MASVEEVKAQVSASVDQTSRAMASLRGVTEQLDEALARLRLTSVGAVHPTVVDAISRLEQAKQRLDEAHTLARGAMDSADRFRAII